MQQHFKLHYAEVL